MTTVERAITKLLRNGFGIEPALSTANRYVATKDGCKPITIYRNGGEFSDLVAVIQVGHTNTFANSIAQAIRWSA